MLYTDEHPSHLLGLSVVRQWETNDDGFAMRFTLTADKNGSGVRVGGFGIEECWKLCFCFGSIILFI